jgi:hypothetical protein
MASALDGSPRKPLVDRGYIGLSFSGGGYRATAFSLGTMALLQDLGLLSKARVMSSVSGGSLALAAYLCAKAGSHPSQESEFHFYERFWDPLMLALGSEELADAFVRLPLLLQGEKVILHAANATQGFLSSLLGEEARLGNNAITDMLRKRNLSPDYVYFNAANIASLDLFRFGIQRGAPSVDGAVEPVYVLNRYYLQAKEGSVEATELYRHARHLRLGDCVAASFAFPGGFEPLIFPHDFCRPDHSPGGPDQAAQAREHFSGSLICDRRPYVAFLDGGLYDNLGLASVEDIRRYLLRRTHALKREPAPSREREQPIHYVIATDVDNIQPGIGFYEEPSLDRQLVGAPCVGGRSGGLSRRVRRLPLLGKVVRALVGVGLLPLLAALVCGLVLGVLLAFLLGGTTPVWLKVGVLGPWPWGLAVLAFLLLLSIALALLWRSICRGVAAVGLMLRRLPRWLGGGARQAPSALTPPSWRQRLGLSRDFDRQGIDNDLVSWLLRAALAVLRSPDRASQLNDLRAATLERRLGQLLPAFNGYLKRTRSLTYGYLQQTYDLAAGNGASASEADRCHLIRNMIFELIPGPDVDPSYASNLITLPLQDYRLQESIAPMAPIMRKLRHADYVRDLLDRRAGRRSPPHAIAPAKQRPMVLPLKLLERDLDLQQSIEQLNLNQAAVHWSWLTASLDVDGDGPQQGAPNPTIHALVSRVHRLLRVAQDAASHALPGVAEPMLRQRCAIKLSESATSYSYIPLICEMATNLNTTLWVKGFCWYVPNQLVEQRITGIGGWYVEPPPGLPDRPLLDLRGISAPAAAITALAGYINTCFNLLEFFYSSLGASVLAQQHLVKKLSAVNEPVESWDEDRRQDLLDLPFHLRNSTYESLKLLSQSSSPPIQPGQVALLEPWLTIREGFPDSWRES